MKYYDSFARCKIADGVASCGCRVGYELLLVRAACLRDICAQDSSKGVLLVKALQVTTNLSNQQNISRSPTSPLRVSENGLLKKCSITGVCWGVFSRCQVKKSNKEDSRDRTVGLYFDDSS